MTNSNELPRARQITATIVFADLVGFDRLSTASGTETAYLAVTQLLRQLDGIARQHGGSVDKYLGDKLMALFGHPLPLENPSREAALAALAMRRRVEAYNREAGLAVPLGVHIGINEGTLVSGEVRGPVVREFHVLGDAVNVAARINARAPSGEIWVGSTVHQAIGATLAARAIEPLELKGKSHPVAVFALAAQHGPGVRDVLSQDEKPACAMVGRDTELAALTATLRRFGDGQGGSVHVEGASGSGKSRLLAELGDSGRVAPFTVRKIDVGEVDGANAMSVFAALLDDVSSRTEEVSGDGEAMLSRLEVSLLDLARKRPLLLVIEDVDQLGAEAMRIVDGVRAMTAKAPILVLTTGRSPAPTDTGPTAGSQIAPSTEGVAPAIENIRLGPLSPSDARTLALAVIGDSTDERTLELVLARGGVWPGSILQAAYLAPVLRSEIEQDSDRRDRSSEAERRRAVVVFADLTGFTAMTEKLGAEKTYPVVAACLEILDEVAREHGGTVDHYLGDCVMATFGVPRAIEDAPRAALNAAIEMRDRIRRYSREHTLVIPVDVHTGVATGMGIAGDISGPMIREFAVMGDHVDRADALTHTAEAGEIFVDATTRKAVSEVFEFEAREPALLPGDPSPQPVYALTSQSVHRHRSQVGAGRQVFSQLVGRDEQMRQIGESIDAVKAGQGGIVSLSAEAGIGKSRLLSEVTSSPEVAGTLWLVGRALSNGRNFSYHPVADLLRSWARIDDDDDDASGRRKLDAAVGGMSLEEESDTAPLLANMMGLELTQAEREHIDSIHGEAAEKIVRAAFVRLLRAASAASSVVIVMEDLHWADLSTIELIESILGLSSAYPILFINAFRPGYEDTSARVLESSRQQHADRHVEITLSPLDASAARMMVKNLFHGGDVPQRTRAAIEERARGNPFYIEEVVRTLVDLGAVEMHDGAFRATEKLEAVQIPDTVQEAVMARVDRLDLARRSVLQAASVIGGTFHLKVLDEVLSSPDLNELLDDLQEAEFISPSDRSAGVEFAFKHPLIPEIIYDSLLESRREELHLLVGNATEAKLSDAMPGYSAMLAFHFSRGRDLTRAEEYLFRAGDEASRAAASNEALHFFQQASALYDELYSGRGETAKRARLEQSLAVALMNRGRLIEAVEHFDGAARLLGHDSPRSTVRMGLHFVRNLTVVLTRLYLGRLKGQRPATDRDKQLCDIMFRRAMAQSTTNPTHFFVDCTELLWTLSRFDPLTVPESAAIYSGLTAIFSFGGISFDVSRRLLEIAHALAAAGAIDERFLYYRALNFLHHLLAGDWSDAHSVPDDVVQEGIREGRFWEASTYLDLDCQRQIYQGHFEAADKRIADLAQMVDLYENELASSAMLAHTTFLHEERRELNDALRTVDIYFDEHSEIMFNIVALGTRGRINARRGDLELAETEIARAEQLAREAGRLPHLHASYVRSARQLLEVLRAERKHARGERPARAELRKLAQSRRKALQTSAWVPWRRTEALRLAGREAWLRGKHAKAVGWWERAIDTATVLGAMPELARTLEDAGLALQDSSVPLTLRGQDAATCLREADRLFASLDLAPEREALARVA